MAQFVNSHSPEVCQEKTAKQVVSKVHLPSSQVSTHSSLEHLSSL